MYWIYLGIFVFAILTPQLIRDGRGMFLEEDIESLLIFFFGALGIMIYLAKEKMLLKVFQEKLHLQKQTSIITRDLSDSYSYIGEMNRTLDIVKDFIFDLPRVTATAFRKREGERYASLLQTAGQLGKTDAVALCFVNIKEKKVERIFSKGSRKYFAERFDVGRILADGKFFLESDGVVIVRSPKQAQGKAAFLLLVKTKNHIEDSDVYKILVSQALLLYSFGHDAPRQQ